MSTKLKILSGVIVALLAVILFLLQEDETLSSEERLTVNFALPKEAQIDRIVIDENQIKRTDADIWRINDKFNIDAEMLESLFSVLGKIEIKRPVPAGMREKVAQLFLSNGIKIKMYEGEKLVKSYTLTGEESESFAMFDENDAFSIYIPGFPLALHKIFEIDENEWRDRTIFKTTARTIKKFENSLGKNAEKALSIQFTTVAADSGYFQVAGIAKTDQRKVIKFINNLERLRVAGFVDENKTQELAKDAKLVATIEVEDIDPMRSVIIKIFQREEMFFGYSEKDKNYFVLDEAVLSRLFLRPQDFIEATK